MGFTHFVMLVTCGVKTKIMVVEAHDEEQATEKAILNFMIDEGVENNLSVVAKMKFSSRNFNQAYSYMRGWTEAETFMNDAVSNRSTPAQKPLDIDNLVPVPGEPGKWMVPEGAQA